MKFFICDKSEKFTKTEYNSFGKWHFYHDDKVSLYEGSDFIVLYCGYLIEGDIEEVAANFSFREQNGNFFAVKLTEDDYEISVDYFQNHKIFVAEKYGIEITNYMPFMRCERNDVVSTKYFYDSELRREFDKKDNTTFYGHVNSYIPEYSYIQDAKRAYECEKWTVDELTDYIYECMLQHAKLIKTKYKNRFISLSEGLDSVLQSQYFYEDPQYMYGITPSYNEVDTEQWRIKTAKNFPNVTHDIWDMRENKNNVKYLKDPSSRWGSILPTMKQISECDTKPDIVMYGVNGDEMFVRDLFANLHMFLFEKYDKFYNNHDYLISSLREHMVNKRSQYGASYSTAIDPDIFIEQFIGMWFHRERDYDEFKKNFYMILTPKFYTRAISANNDVISGSLYNDKRIYHEVMKMSSDWLIENSMDSPIQRKILKERFDYNFITPHKDAVYSQHYDGIFNRHFNATAPLCLEQNI